MRNMAIRSALMTVITLFGGIAVGVTMGQLVLELIPGSDANNLRIGHALIAAVPAFGGVLAGGAAWGMQVGRLAGAGQTRRMAIAGMVGFGPITILLAVGLGLGEPAIVSALFETAPIHRVFTLLFVPSAFLITGASVYAAGRGLGDAALARRLFWKVGLAAAGAFLLINLVMESLGWVIGAPGAVERFTMLTVLALSNLGAALVGGGVLGFLLARENMSAGIQETALMGNTAKSA